jgi:hypothetical protein
MTVGTLPKPLVVRLRKAVSYGEKPVRWPEVNVRRHEKVMGRMKNADHRHYREGGWGWDSIHLFGGRVRELDVHRNYPELGQVIIKRVHEIEALRLIRLLRRTVDMHNGRYPNKSYTLRKPVAYAIGERYVAMRKVAYPSVAEITGGGYLNVADLKRMWDPNFATARGFKFFEEVARGHPKCTIAALKEAVMELEYNTDAVYHSIHNTNILLTGFEKEKFVFVPLMDLK